MATAKPTADAKKAQNFFFVNPLDDNIIIDQSLNTTRRNPYTEEEIIECGRDWLEEGQINAVEAREEDGNYIIVDGFRRALGARWRAENIDPHFRLQIKVVPNCSEDDHRRRNVRENYQKKDPNAADAAKAIKELVETQALTDEQLGKLFGGKSVAWVQQHKRLNKLPDRHLNALQIGLLTTTTCLDALKLDAKSRNKVLDKIVSEKKAGKEVTVRMAQKMVAHAAAEKHQEHQEQTEESDVSSNGQETETVEAVEETSEDTEAPKTNGKAPREPNRPKPPTPHFSRGMPDVRQFFTDLEQCGDYPSSINNLGKTFMLWLQGKLHTKPDKADELLHEALEMVWMDVPEGQQNANGEDVSKGWTK